MSKSNKSKGAEEGWISYSFCYWLINDMGRYFLLPRSTILSSVYSLWCTPFGREIAPLSSWKRFAKFLLLQILCCRKEFLVSIPYLRIDVF